MTFRHDWAVASKHLRLKFVAFMLAVFIVGGYGTYRAIRLYFTSDYRDCIQAVLCILLILVLKKLDEEALKNKARKS